MGQFDRQIATAIRLIAKNGEIASWAQLNPGVVADVTKPWVKRSDGETLFAASIVFLPRNRVNTAFMQALGKTDIRVGKVYGLMGAVSFVPTLKDRVTRVNGDVYKINALDELNPNGQIILYTIDFDV